MEEFGNIKAQQKLTERMADAEWSATIVDKNK